MIIHENPLQPGFAPLQLNSAAMSCVVLNYLFRVENAYVTKRQSNNKFRLAIIRYHHQASEKRRSRNHAHDTNYFTCRCPMPTANPMCFEYHRLCQLTRQCHSIRIYENVHSIHESPSLSWFVCNDELNLVTVESLVTFGCSLA